MNKLVEEEASLAKITGPITMETASRIMHVLLHHKLWEIMADTPHIKEIDDWYAGFLTETYQHLFLYPQSSEDKAKQASDLMGAVIQLDAIDAAIQKLISEESQKEQRTLKEEMLSNRFAYTIGKRTEGFRARLMDAFNALTLPQLQPVQHGTLRALLEARIQPT